MKIKTLLFSLLTITLLAGFTSCGDDDNDDNKHYDKRILGRWNYTAGSIEVIAETNNTVFTEVLKADIIDDLDDDNYNLTLQGNHAYKIEYPEAPETNESGQYTFENGILQLGNRYPAKATVYANKLALEFNLISNYDLSAIKYLIDNEPTLAGVEPASIKITKAIGIIKYTR